MHVAFAACLLGLVPVHAPAQTQEPTGAASKAENEAAAQTDWMKALEPLPGGGWTRLTTAPDGSWALYQSSHQLIRANGIVRMWLRWEFRSPQLESGVSPYSSLITLVELNCPQIESRTLSNIFYAENNLGGASQSFPSTAKDVPWEPIPPGTVHETLWSAYCGKPVK
jgi:hypothetical protein